MAYVEWHDTVRNHPKTDALMLALKIKRREAVGIVGCISSWCIQYRPGGRLEKRNVIVATEWDGDKKALIEALTVRDENGKNIGWLDEIDADWVAVHDWKDITRGYRKAREDAARKKREYRASLHGDSAETPRSARVSPRSRAPSGTTGTTGTNGTEQEECSELPKTSASEQTATHPDLSGFDLYAKDTKLNRSWPTLRPALEKACPGVDVMAEIAKAHAWEIGNPSRRKKDRPKFLTNWCMRQQDRAGQVRGEHASGTENLPRVIRKLPGESLEAAKRRLGEE